MRFPFDITLSQKPAEIRTSVTGSWQPSLTPSSLSKITAAPLHEFETARNRAKANLNEKVQPGVECDDGGANAGNGVRILELVK